MGRRKKVRTDRESGPIRFSDRIRNWFLYGDPLTCETELEYINAYFKAKNWPPLAEKILYRGDDELPEMVNALFAMHSYDILREQRAGKKDFDI